MRRCLVGIAVLIVPATAQAVEQNDLTAVGADASRSFLGQGRHVLIGVLDGGLDAGHPAIRGSVVAAKDFSGSGTTNDDPSGAGHATGIAGLYVGHAADYTGIVPKAGIINARVITSRDDTTDTMSGNGLFYALNLGAKVINLSYGNKLGDGSLTNKFNLMVDYASEQYGASVVSASGNDNDTAIQQTPAGAYNGFGVGSLAAAKYNEVSSFSNYALSTDRRSKPDIAAPGQSVERADADWETKSAYSLGSGTSFSTPIVGGVLAQMIGFGQSAGLPTDPRLLRAVMLTSADKEYDTDGTPWSPRHSFTNAKGVRVTDQPLDDQQGAGRLNAMQAYRVYAKARNSGTPVADWAFTSVKRGQVFNLNLGHLSAGERVDSSMVWDYHVGVTDNGNRVVDAGDKFYQAVPLADFALSLVKDGRVVATSDSAYDNLEHFSITLASSGNYVLEVYRHRYGGSKNETFGVAAEVLANPPGLPPLTASAALMGGTSGVSRAFDQAVPEPSSLMTVSAAMGGLLLRRRRTRF